jgi:hypothetical protein
MDSLKDAMTVLKFAIYDGKKELHSFWLDRSKLLVGTSPQSDIQLKDRHISHYHALVTVSEDSISICDLGSTNGIFVNGERITTSELLTGDLIRLGSTDIYLEEGVRVDNGGAARGVVNLDSEVQIYADKLLSEHVVAVPSKKNLVLIDDEYCDIEFDQPEIELPADLPLGVDQHLLTDYADFSEVEVERNLAKPQTGNCLEVSLVSNGVMISMDHLPLDQKKYYISPNRRSFSKDITLPLVSERTLLVEQLDQELVIHQLEGFNLAVNGSSSNDQRVPLAADGLAIWQLGSAQIMLRMVETPPSLKGVPFWGRDKEFYKQVCQVVLAVMGLMMLLLIVDVDEMKKEPERKLAVIYRIKSNTELLVENPTKSKGEQQDLKKVAKSKQKEVKPVEVKKIVKQQAPARSTKKVAAKKSKVVKKVAAKVKSRRYHFKLDNSLTSLAKKSVLPAKVKLAAKRRVASVNPLGVNSSELSDDRSLSNQKVRVGKLSDRYQGKMNLASGSRGLSKKQGYDSTYISPKTVVLGSIDPELLRKILREYIPQFKHCYQQELRKNSDSVQGVLSLNFQIGRTGSVKKVNIVTGKTSFSQGGVNCMASVLRVIDFPTPKGGGVVDVRQPLNFFARQGKI